MTVELVVAEDLADQATRLFLDIAPRTVALAGGSTPRALYERLAEARFDWASVDVFFGDERCVPPDDAASNYGMAHRALLSKVNARVHRARGETCDAGEYEKELRKVFGERVPRFELILLGLGEDGHTASLFPDDPALEVEDRLVVAVDRPDYRRLTFTLPLLSAARNVLFLVSGVSKRAALRELLGGGDIPASRVNAERTIVICDPPSVPVGFKPGS